MLSTNPCPRRGRRIIAYQHLPSGEIAAEVWQANPGAAAPAWLESRAWHEAPARPGDWVVMDKFGLLDVCTAEEFAAKFRAVEVEEKAVALETI